MNYFSDQIKHASTRFVVRLYIITKQYYIMSLLRIEESVGLAPMAHEQDLLGSRDSQGKEPAPDEATKTQTMSDERMTLPCGLQILGFISFNSAGSWTSVQEMVSF